MIASDTTVASDDVGAWIADNLEIVIPAAVGALVLIVAVILLIVFLVRRKKNSEHSASAAAYPTISGPRGSSVRKSGGGAATSGTEMNIEWLDEISDEDISEIST
jgi:hypothetical protein